jgi:hypothetical protein
VAKAISAAAMPPTVSFGKKNSIPALPAATVLPRPTTSTVGEPAQRREAAAALNGIDGKQAQKRELMPQLALPPNADDTFDTPRGTRTVSLDAKYLERRASVTEAIVELPCGVSLNFFRDGNTGGVPVLALHGTTDCKWAWLMQRRIPGVDLVAIDRPGYGRSSACESWEITLLAYKELADLLGFPQFVALGLGAGAAVWCVAAPLFRRPAPQPAARRR